MLGLFEEQDFFQLRGFCSDYTCHSISHDLENMHILAVQNGHRTDKLHDIVQKSFNLPIIHAQDLLPIWQALAVLQELISWATGITNL